KGAPAVPVAAPMGAVGSPHSMGHPAQPRRKPLPHIKALGARPDKPRRPPVVDLEKFGASAHPGTPIHPAMEPPRSAQLELSNRSLPPHRDEDKIYDDVEPVGLIRRAQGFPLPAMCQPPANPCPRGG
ncbi:hypothetical protein N333_00967, partial [Nestor notabilis]